MEAHIFRHKTNTDNFPRWLTLLRIILGFILIAKGISFIHDSTALESIIHRKGWDLFDNNRQATTVLITYANLLGGVFIATGLITRWAALVQIPILIGAVIFNLQQGISFSNTELMLSAI